MVAEAKAAPGQESQFVAPTPGITPSQRWLQKCALAPDHVAAGDFSSAMRLLNRYVGVVSLLNRAHKLGLDHRSHNLCTTCIIALTAPCNTDSQLAFVSDDLQQGSAPPSCFSVSQLRQSHKLLYCKAPV